MGVTWVHSAQSAGHSFWVTYKSVGSIFDPRARKRLVSGHRREKLNQCLRRHQNFCCFTCWNLSDWYINGPGHDLFSAENLFSATNKLVLKFVERNQKSLLEMLMHLKIKLTDPFHRKRSKLIGFFCQNLLVSRYYFSRVMIRHEVVVMGGEGRWEATRGNKAVASTPESTHQHRTFGCGVVI